MSELTEFSNHGYQVQRELGQNRAGGRVTYLATSTNTQQPVVLKQFQFAKVGANWSGYDAYDREIELLRCLNHPSIPRYLDSVETPSGLCLVQEYKQAPSLAQPQLFTPEEIKQIAVAVLEVLVYLQQQITPVIHRDIKPENILVDRQGDRVKVYLVDFGFARMGDGEVAVSSVVKGTLGFMPPEQLFNRQLTKASDLYSLGATLICLLTGTKSNEIGNLIDETYRINFKHLVPQLNPQFIAWLEKMVAPSLKQRFPDAATALEALKPIPVVATTTKPAVPVSATRILMQFTISLLASIGGFVVLLGAIAAIFSSRQPEYANSEVEYASPVDPVQQLLAHNESPYGDFRGENLEGSQLQHAKLFGADLKGANLENADLTGAELGNANLKGTNLTGAYLTRARLENAKLEDAKLKGAQLWGAKLEGAYLEGAKLESAKLGGANLERANLEGSNLKDANLGDAKLTNANLAGANLEGANLGSASLEEANLRDANLRDANLTGAKLWGANLEGANLEGANLEGANLGGANLKDAKLKGAKLKGATLPEGTIHP